MQRKPLALEEGGEDAFRRDQIITLWLPLLFPSRIRPECTHLRENIAKRLRMREAAIGRAITTQGGSGGDGSPGVSGRARKIGAHRRQEFRGEKIGEWAL